MDTKELKERIMAIRMLIQELHPELAMYLNEMPVIDPTSVDSHLNKQILKEYYLTLADILNETV